MGRTGRYAAVITAAAALCAAPALIGSLPAQADRVALGVLLGRARGSADVGYSGLAESRGSLGLPDVPRIGDVANLFSSTVRTRVWYAAPTRWRVDRLTLVGEQDVVRDPAGQWQWSSEDREAVRYDVVDGLRLPQPADLLPPEIGRRLLSPATDADLTRLPDRRVAGRVAAGIRVRPRGVTTITEFDVWMDTRSGLPLRVDVRAGSGEVPVVTARFLDVKIGNPATGVTTFAPPADARVDGRSVPDLVSAIDRFGDFPLPASVAGLPRRVRVAGVGGGVATYGDGYTLVAVVPLRGDFAHSVVDRLLGGAPALDVGGRRAASAPSAAINTFVVTGRPGYLLAGTVPMALLKRAAAQLVAS